MEISESTVVVQYEQNTYEFARTDSDTVRPTSEEKIPQEVKREVQNRGFFLCDYPQTFTWKFVDLRYEYQDVLNEIPNGIIQPNSTEHESLYNLVAGEYGGLRAQIEVGQDGVCRIVGLENELPIKGYID